MTLDEVANLVSPRKTQSLVSHDVFEPLQSIGSVDRMRHLV